MKKLTLHGVVFTCLVVFIFTISADARGLRHNPQVKRVDGWIAAIELLGLTPEQMEAIEALRESGKEQVQEILASIEENRELLKEELEKPEPDLEKAGELTQTIYELMGQLREVQEQTHESILNVLTDEQKAIAEEAGEIALIMRAIPALHRLGLLAPEEIPEPEL